jgi:dCTP deaminase
MILTGLEIQKEMLAGRIVIEPYDSKLLNPNSYNIRLGKTVRQYADDAILDTRAKVPTTETLIPPQGMVLQPDKLYLGHTVERIGSDSYAPFIGGRSSTGRLGLFVHITAPLGDIGFVGEWTLQLRATVPVRVYPEQEIGQMFFVQPYGKIEQYKGKYQGSVGPQAFEPSELHGESLPRAPVDSYAAMPDVLSRLPESKRLGLDAEARATAQRLITHAPTGPLSVLDVGCGTGILLSALEELPRFRTIAGIDSSPSVLWEASRHLSRSLLCRDDFTSFDFGEKRFDIVAALAFLHLFPKRHVNLILNRIRALLSTDGLIVASTTVHQKSEEHWAEKTSIPGAWRFRSRYTLSEWRNVFGSGWRIIDEWSADEIMDPGSGRKWCYIVARPI